MKLKNKRVKIGLFIPPAFSPGVSRSIHNPGIGRLSNDICSKIIERFKKAGYHVVTECNFRDAIIVNNNVIFNESKTSFKNFFWYCEIDRSKNSFDFSLLNALSRKINVIRDPKLVDLAMDKYTAFSLLRENHVSVSECILVDVKNIHNTKTIVQEWGNFLLKPRRGGFGKGVTLLSSFESLRDTVEYINATNKFANTEGHYIERFYDNNATDWVSVTIIDGKIMYGYRKNLDRFSSLGGRRYKVYSKDEVGGGVSICKLTLQHKRLALKAYKALGLEIIGFDMVLHNNKPIIVDVNTFPGMYPELFALQSIDPSKVFYDLIVKKIEL